nr:hypothetical protein [Chromatium okenii]
MGAKNAGYSGADIEAVVKEAIEKAFVQNCATLDNARYCASSIIRIRCVK